MSKPIFAVAAILAFFLFSCAPDRPSGIYVCDQSGKQKDTTIITDGVPEVVMDMQCVFTQFEFKGKSTVLVSTGGGSVGFGYVMDEDIVRIKGNGSDIILTMQGQNTLTGEGLAEGTYHKK